MSSERQSQNDKYYGKDIMRIKKKNRESSGIVKKNHLENKGYILLFYSDSVSQRYL